MKLHQARQLSLKRAEKKKNFLVNWGGSNPEENGMLENQQQSYGVKDTTENSRTEKFEQYWYLVFKMDKSMHLGLLSKHKVEKEITRPKTSLFWERNWGKNILKCLICNIHNTGIEVISGGNATYRSIWSRRVKFMKRFLCDSSWKLCAYEIFLQWLQYEFNMSVYIWVHLLLETGAEITCFGAFSNISLLSVVQIPLNWIVS